MWKTSRCLSSDENENIPESPLLTAVTQTLQTAEKNNMWSFSERLNECASLFVCMSLKLASKLVSCQQEVFCVLHAERPQLWRCS